MGFDHVTNQIYISIDIQKWYLICLVVHVHNDTSIWKDALNIIRVLTKY